jgi:phosphoribosylanthranilate isomerase
MKIKVCGITQLSQLQELNNIDVDFVGLIFYSGSPRYMLPKLKSIDVSSMKLAAQKVGVFVNAAESDIMTQIELYGLEVVQLHGNETPTFCNHISNHVKVIKAFRINEQLTNIDWMVKPYEEACDFYLFDQGAIGIYGGTGKKFDWSLIENSNIGKDFFLSGGIGPEDASALKDFKHSFLYGIDINSKFETEPGIKDMGLVKGFIDSVKK